MVDYPIFQEYYDLYGNSDITVSEFINIIDFKQTIILDSNYYNVIVHSSLKQTMKYLDAINELSEDKKIKFYEITNDVELRCVEREFSILDDLNIVGNFDLFVLISSSHNYTNMRLFQKFQTLTLYLRKIPSKLDELNSINIDENLLLIEYEELNFIPRRKSVEYYCDIKLSELNCNPHLNVIKSLNKVIDRYLHSIKIEIQNNEKTNILILYADNGTINNQKYKRIIKELLGNDIIFDDVDAYYLGINIGINNPPFINRGSINNIECEGKFDIILSEHCPLKVFNDNLELFKSLLKDKGMIIIPDYKIKNINGLRKIIENRYIGYMKNN